MKRSSSNRFKHVASSDAPMIGANPDLAYRSFQILRSEITDDSRTIEFSFSSEIELERWPGVVEVLSHEPGAVDLTRLLNGAQLLFNHDPDKYIGVVESASISPDRKGRCTVRFSENECGEKVWKDVQAGILRNVSVGYRIHEVKITEERANGLEINTVGKWEPYEVSIVTIPADVSVGIGRNIRSLFSNSQRISDNQNIMNRTQMLAALRARGLTVDESITDEALTSLVTRNLSEPPAAPPAPRTQIEVVADRSHGANTERERVNVILAAGRTYKADELAQAAIAEGHSIDQFRATLLETVDKRNLAVVDGTRPIGLTDKEARGFSFVKLMRALSAPSEDRRRYIEDAKFELEACEAAGDQISHRSLKGTAIPTDVLMAPMQQRDVVSMKTGVGFTGTAGATMQTTLLSSSFIDLLYNKTTILQLGTELGGLVGNLDIPKQIAGTTAYWLGEDDPSTSLEDIEFGLVQLQPKTVANMGEVTRKGLMQSSISMEALFRNDLATGLGLEIDRAGFYGLATANQPRGLKLLAGLNTANWTAANAPTFAELVAMETAIAAGNAEAGGMAYVMNPTMRGYLKTSQKFAATNGQAIWEPGNTVNGYRTETTNQIATGDIFFGNFADLLIGMWGGLDITVDPYTHSAKGRIRYTCFQDVDFAHRRTQSFAFRRNV